jgi:flagellar basal-body rod modification protein FlgD
MADSSALVGNVSSLLGQAETTSKKASNKELGKDAFLQLLVAQLKNQDPMKPMDDTSFIAEMAQFSSLEQMQNLNKTMESAQQFGALSQAAGMIGKYVVIQDSSSGDGSSQYTGQVSEVRSSGGELKVVIGGQEYKASDILQVGATPFTNVKSGASTTTGASDTTTNSNTTTNTTTSDATASDTTSSGNTTDNGQPAQS